MLIIFHKNYDGESLYDLSRDIGEAFEGDFNPVINTVPQNEHGFQQGVFRVTIEWQADLAKVGARKTAPVQLELDFGV